MQKEIKKNIFIKNKNKIFTTFGFTLIETLVAVTLFTFVTFVALSSLFQMQALNAKLKITKSIYNNMYFTVDNITSEIKQGSNFENSNYVLTGIADNCNVTVNNNSCIAFDYLNIEGSNNSERRGYYLDSINGSIKKYVGLQPAETITSEDLNVQILKFVIEGNNTYSGSVDSAQPSVKVIIKGLTKKKPEIPFYIETFISQRSLTN